MTLFLLVLFMISLQGAIMPEMLLDLTEQQRWYGVAFMGAVNIFFHLIIRPWWYRKLNDR